ncbi:FCD domain-containing protein [Paracoccus sp. 1_MG-2023]|uniref:FadR/GntR family transcriptional regulator n=1 Tax=Paracoccus sp. 1_MG-2023 TaxID=3062651 RepID=UPI0026E2ED9C|nr:FCD domain-containing protein [Paracoccus sp. 1_MG-2023]MDO6667313.1 FCD domain-containing protein [Paracoccus sp. 1_MG-2023]
MGEASGQTADLVRRLREFLAEAGFSHSDRLPPERALVAEFGVTRAELRKALQVLEGDGLIWRHVGRGTFLGARPVHNLGDLAYLRDLARPVQLLEARMAIEPEIARLAALHSTVQDHDRLRHWAERARRAADWRMYEAADTNLHNAIAQAAHNKLLMHLFNEINTVKRAVLWNVERRSTRPPQDHFAFPQHDAIIGAIEGRRPDTAVRLMRDHLASVGANLPPGAAR